MSMRGARGLRALAARVRRLVAYAYQVGIAPAVGYLPAPLAYTIACLRGDWRYHRDVTTRERIVDNLGAVLGEQVSPGDRLRIAREYCRLHYCAAVDELRLRSSGRSWTRLVEVRGLDRVERALAAGRGALLCTAHFGSYRACFSLLGARGWPITAIKREVDEPGASWLRQRSLRVYNERVARHMHRPNINPTEGRFAATQAARVLQRNELLGVYIDPPALPADRERTVASDFLGRQANVLSGIMAVAQRTGCPVFVALLYRSADWRHQVFEISPPVSAGDPAAALRQCLAYVETAVRAHPAHWLYWARTDDLIDLGLLSPEPASVAG